MNKTQIKITVLFIALLVAQISGVFKAIDSNTLSTIGINYNGYVTAMWVVLPMCYIALMFKNKKETK